MDMVNKLANKMPDLSVIVPAYNIENYIERCINSLLNQKSINLEIIIVDDGSTDRTGKIVDEYAKKERMIQVIHQQNQGLYKSRTNGILYANSEYITFCDGDDYIDNDFYGKTLKEFKKINCDVLQFGYKKVKENQTLWTFVPAPFEKDGRAALKSMFETLHFANSNWCKIYKRSLFKDICFDENVRCNDEDVLIHSKILPRAKKVCSISDAGYNYDTRDGSIVDVAKSMKGINILNTDRIIYQYVSEHYDTEVKRSAAYDYSAKLAYWYNKCICAGQSGKAIKINKEFRRIVRENGLFGYIPKDASYRRVLMIHLLYLCPPLCTLAYKFAIKE